MNCLLCWAQAADCCELAPHASEHEVKQDPAMGAVACVGAMNIGEMMQEGSNATVTKTARAS